MTTHLWKPSAGVFFSDRVAPLPGQRASRRRGLLPPQRGWGLPARGQRPNDLSFCEKKGLLDFQRKKAHRQTAIFYFRRASGYTRSIHRTLPFLFRLRSCQHPHWAATAPLIAAPAAREVEQRYRNSIEQRQRKEGLRLSSDRTAVDRTWYLADAA